MKKGFAEEFKEIEAKANRPNRLGAAVVTWLFEKPLVFYAGLVDDYAASIDRHSPRQQEESPQKILPAILEGSGVVVEDPGIIDATFDGLGDRLPDSEIPHLSPVEAVTAINANVPKDPRFN